MPGCLEPRPGRRDAGERAELERQIRNPKSEIRNSSIRAVLFDAGATLLHPDPPVEAVYAREFAREGVSLTEESLSRALTQAWEEIHAEAAGDRYGGVRGEADFWKAFLNRVRRDLDGGVVSGESFARLAVHFRDPGSWSIYEDVAPTLNLLEARGILLAVVSNWDSHLPELLEELGLARRFGVLLVSAIEEIGKPDPEIFRRACARLGVPPEAALHVGDSLKEDYEGAHSAGLEALLLDRDERHPEIADRIVSLEEIPRRLARATGAGAPHSEDPS